MRSALTTIQNFRRERGYTLIETAIVLVIIGLMLASFMAAYRVYLASQARLITEVNTAQLADNLGDFLVRNGRYPCPARLNAQRGDADYGVETQCDSAATPELPALGDANGDGVGAYPTDITPGVPAAGSYVDGLYFETSLKFADINPSSINDDPTNVLTYCNRDTGPASANNCAIPRVRRGAVPFRTLGIPEEKSEDGYKNRIQYVITEPLAVSRNYTKSGGGINIVKGRPGFGEDAVISPEYSAHFYLFSSGPDKKGAYTRYGQLVEACQTTAADGENCNTAVGGVLSRSVYRHTDYSTANSAFHFDDFAKFYSSVQQPLWQVLSGGFDIKDLIEAEATPTKTNLVGISVDPDNNPTNFGGLAANIPVLQVGGNIVADGNTLASELCDAAHNNCFQVDKISSDGSVQDESHFQCPTGTTPYATGIGSQQIKCTANIVTRCGDGEVMTGVKPTGELECTSVVGCLPRSVDLCTIAGVTDTRNIGGGTQNQTITFSPVSGSSYTETWTCGPGAGGAGEWTRTATSGFCVCNPVNTSTTDACNNRRTGNWTGVYTDTFTHVCPANTSSTTSTNNCVCSPRTESRTVGCPAGLTGAVTQTRNWICDSTTAGHYTAWTNASSTCTCTPASETQTIGCATGFSGSITRQRNFTCPAATWGGWTETANTCTCTGGTQNQTLACAAGLTGSIQQTRNFNCAATPPAWGAWGTTSNTCACVSTSETRNVSCPANYTGSIAQKRDFTCPSATWGSWYQTGSTCTCSGGSETRTVACTAPLVGSKKEKRDFNCMAAPPAWGSWYLDEDNCGLVTYSWAPKTAPTGPYGSPLPNSAGGACSNNTLVAPCSAATAGAQYYHYTTCQCE
jgi:prepilin-type N-terminal cleavage/methylation domain-containing protein